jgi:hypothetical protein
MQTGLDIKDGDKIYCIDDVFPWFKAHKCYIYVCTMDKHHDYIDPSYVLDDDVTGYRGFFYGKLNEYFCSLKEYRRRKLEQIQKI